MEYKRGVQAAAQGQQQQAMGTSMHSSAGDSLPTLPSGQGFYTLESLQGFSSSTVQNSQQLFPPGTSYGPYGLMQHQHVVSSDGTIPPGAYGLAQQNMPPELTMPPGTYGSAQQQQHAIRPELSTGPYGSMQPDYGRPNMYLDPAHNPQVYGSYALMQQAYEVKGMHSEPGLMPPGHDFPMHSRMAPGSMPPPRYPLEHHSGHFPPEDGYAPWIHDDSHSRYPQPVRLTSSLPPRVPLHSPFPGPAHNGERGTPGFEDGQWPPQKEPTREYVAQTLSYRGLGNPSKAEVFKPGASGTARKMVGPFKGIPALPGTKKKTIPKKSSKQHEPIVVGPAGAGWCSVCEIDCNTKDVLEQHKGGKKHKKKLEKQEAQLAVQKKINERHMQQFKNLEKGSRDQEKDLKDDKKAVTLILSVNGSTESNKNQNERAIIESQKEQQQSDINQKPDSNHGKRKLEKLKGAADNILIKRQRLLDAGTAIEAVKVCSLCNAVCNSQTVFDSHLAGKKHAAQLKKLEEDAKAVSEGKDDSKKPVEDSKVIM
eukprot:Gb_40020 [translate_table: standard]